MDQHIPVLLREVLEGFEGRSLKVFFEGTVGLGGHSKAILEAHPEIEAYFGCDRDENALIIAQQTLAPWGEKVNFIHAPFAEMNRILGEKKIDGFFIDIGVSSMQLDTPERGFSFRSDAPLDMRMDLTDGVTAEELVNELSETELARIFYEYGEEFRSRAAAKAIVTARQKKRITTTHALTKVLEPVLRKGKIHFATKVFQALRIAVNNELEQLRKGIESAVDHLNIGGVIGVISFHSLEDRIVKWAFREDKRVKILTKKPIQASREEMKKNPRARSAKLRLAEKGEQ